MKTKSSRKIHVAWLKKIKEKTKDAIRLSKCKTLRCKKTIDCLRGESFILWGISKNN